MALLLALPVILPLCAGGSPGPPAAAVGAVGPADSVEQWGRWEQSWEGPAVGNPYTDVELMVDLTSVADAASTAGVTTVRGFYDGSGRYMARFMPPTTGAWKFATRSTAPELNGKHGQFLVNPPTKTAGQGANHGPVLAAPNQTKFAHADGTPFFAVATTVYGMFLNASVTLPTLAKSPFNKVRTLFGTNESVYQRTNPTNATDMSVDPTQFNLRGFRHVESVLDSMAEIGVQAEIILFMNGFPYPASQGCVHIPPCKCSP